MKGKALFVVGSLAGGTAHFEKLKDLIEESFPAQAMGTVYRLPSGYPVFHSQGRNLIDGEVLVFRSSQTLESWLDELFGYSRLNPSRGLHIKEMITVGGPLGPEEVQAYSVIVEKLPRDSQLIEGGDWRSALRAQPPIAERLTQSQLGYIRKLGGSRGREIVPIDLALYRQLMSLELIVDKGRRLALSPLGREVYRYVR